MPFGHCHPATRPAGHAASPPLLRCPPPSLPVRRLHDSNRAPSGTLPQPKPAATLPAIACSCPTVLHCTSPLPARRHMAQPRRHHPAFCPSSLSATLRAQPPLHRATITPPACEAVHVEDAFEDLGALQVTMQPGVRREAPCAWAHPHHVPGQAGGRARVELVAGLRTPVWSGRAAGAGSCAWLPRHYGMKTSAS